MLCGVLMWFALCCVLLRCVLCCVEVKVCRGYLVWRDVLLCCVLLCRVLLR